MAKEKTTIVRLRAIIIHEGKLLVVKHTGVAGNATALPGGKLEFGEDLKKGMERELIEELGVAPVLGRLMYVNNWTYGDEQNIEFFFEVTNSKEYFDAEVLKGSHSFEISEILWQSPRDEITLLPEKFASDFKNDAVLSDEIKYIFN